MVLEIHIKQPGGDADRSLRFSRSPVRIGRNQLNDISLQDPFVSEWHGVIRFDDKSIAYFDLGSTNGTLLDDKRLTKNVASALTERSRLQLGLIEIRIVPVRPEQLEGAKTPPPPARSDTGPFKTLAWGQMAAPPAPARGPVVSGDQGRGEPRKTEAAFGITGAPSAFTPPPKARGDITGPDPRVPDTRSGARAPEPAAPSAPAAAPRHEAELIARQARLLEAFGEAFVGLLKGYEQFGAEVGVRTLSGSTPLHRARSSRELLDHLMHPSVDPGAAARDLISIFADLGIHNIALMEGITEGVREVLQTLDPRTNELDVGSRLFTASKTKSQWKSYIERFEQLITDDDELHAAIFSDGFARAYASVAVGDGRDSRTHEET